MIIEKVRRLAATSKLRLLPDYASYLPVLSRYCCARPLRSVQHFFGLIHSVDGGVELNSPPCHPSWADWLLWSTITSRWNESDKLELEKSGLPSAM